MCKIFKETIDNIIYTYLCFVMNTENINILLEEKNLETKTIKIFNNIFTKNNNFYIKPSENELIKCTILDSNELMIKYNNFINKNKFIYFHYYCNEVKDYLKSIYEIQKDYKYI